MAIICVLHERGHQIARVQSTQCAKCCGRSSARSWWQNALCVSCGMHGFNFLGMAGIAFPDSECKKGNIRSREPSTPRALGGTHSTVPFVGGVYINLRQKAVTCSAYWYGEGFGFTLQTFWKLFADPQPEPAVHVSCWRVWACGLEGT